jgi:hypothetical protein
VADPIRAWFDRVTLPVLAAHYHPRQKERQERNASLIAELLGDDARILHHSETGEVLDSVYQASLQTGLIQFATPYTRMHVMQIARFLGNLLSELGHAGYRLTSPIIPHLSEVFAVFNNSDDSFRRRKNWSIYR